MILYKWLVCVYNGLSCRKTLRKQLINEIANIYPVEERVDKSGRRDFSIFGFVVPNAEDISSIKSADEDKVATGLGYTAHILLMISQFLDMPLRFHIVHCGSRCGPTAMISMKIFDAIWIL